MKTHNLKLFNTGQVTLPKTRREQFSTTLFIATETPEGLLIQPILQNNSSQNHSLDNFIVQLKQQASTQ